MKKIAIWVLMFFSSCIYDKLTKIVVVKNESKTNICVIYGDDKINDDRLFYGNKYSVKAMSSDTIFGPDSRSKGLKRTFYFFNEDTVYKRIKAGIVKGIVEKSLIKKYTLDINTLKLNETIIFP